MRGPMTPYSLLHPADEVWIALADIVVGSDLSCGLRLTTNVSSGHKIARHAVSRCGPVHRCYQTIGLASADVTPGAHVHIHNLAMG